MSLKRNVIYTKLLVCRDQIDRDARSYAKSVLPHLCVVEWFKSDVNTQRALAKKDDNYSKLNHESHTSQSVLEVNVWVNTGP